MPKRVPNKRHTGEFKQMVTETMICDKLSYREVARQFEISGHEQTRKWDGSTLRRVRNVCTLNIVVAAAKAVN